MPQTGVSFAPQPAGAHARAHRRSVSAPPSPPSPCLRPCSCPVGAAYAVLRLRSEPSAFIGLRVPSLRSHFHVPLIFSHCDIFFS